MKAASTLGSSINFVSANLMLSGLRFPFSTEFMNGSMYEYGVVREKFSENSF